jgi:DNA-binding response OmpR family regulator
MVAQGFDLFRQSNRDWVPLMGSRVLIVDADLDTLTSTEGWLKEAEYETTAATTFLEARAALDTGAFDVLIADVRLGAYNGIHLVLLARHRTPQIRTIVTHTATNGSLETEARRAGAHVYLPKPLTRWVLLSAVEAAAHADEDAQAVLRRWPRMRLARSWEGRIADAQARVVDVSYGGVRVELAKSQRADLGSLVRLDMVEPGLSVQVRPVWARKSPFLGAWWCGAEIADPDPAVDRRWRSLVDSLAGAQA